MNTDNIKEKIEALEQDITIYKNDLKRSVANLKKEFNLEESEIEDRIDSIETGLEKLKRKKRKVSTEIEEDLKHANS